MPQGEICEAPVVVAPVPEGFVCELTYGERVNRSRNIARLLRGREFRLLRTAA